MHRSPLARAAKDALCKIANLGCGLVDTFAYYTAPELEAGFKKCCAYQPRVIKQNRGSAGEGIWLCWLANGDVFFTCNGRHLGVAFTEASGRYRA